jgi:hypothetical protein
MPPTPPPPAITPRTPTPPPPPRMEGKCVPYDIGKASILSVVQVSI